MKHTKIYEPVFRSTVYFYQSNDIKEAVKHADKKYKIDFSDEDMEFYKGSIWEVTDKGIMKWIVWIKYKKDWKTMVHEVAHLVFRILDNRGIKSNGKESETFAYLQEFFVSEFWHVMCKN